MEQKLQMESQQAQQQAPAIPVEVQIMKMEQDAKFALTPVGQTVKNFEVTQRMAKLYALSDLVPQAYRNSLGNCCIALDMAMRMNANPLMVMQNLAVVHGNPSFSSKFLIATINASGKFSPLRYEVDNEEHPTKCRCYAYEANDKERKEKLVGTWISLEMAKKEGWSTKNGSKWLTMPEQMLKYRAAAFWQRIYCPEISMGFLTTEEEIDIQDAEEVVDNNKANNRWGFVNADEQPLQPQLEAEPKAEVSEEVEETNLQPEAELKPEAELEASKANVETNRANSLFGGK